MVLTEFELHRLWARHNFQGGDVMTFARDVEREVLYNAAKTMEEKGMPAEWAKALRDLIV